MKIIERLCPPTRLNIEPQYTLYKHNIDDNNYEYYLQLGTNEEMDWQPIPNVLNGMFKEFYDDEKFLDILVADDDSYKLKLFVDYIDSHDID